MLSWDPADQAGQWADKPCIVEGGRVYPGPFGPIRRVGSIERSPAPPEKTSLASHIGRRFSAPSSTQSQRPVLPSGRTWRRLASPRNLQAAHTVPRTPSAGNRQVVEVCANRWLTSSRPTIIANPVIGRWEVPKAVFRYFQPAIGERGPAQRG